MSVSIPAGATAAPPRPLLRAGRPFGGVPAGGPLWPTYLTGVLGAVLVTVGSAGVGWLASVSALNQVRWLIPLRTSEAGVVGSVIALTLGFWIMFRAWLRLAQVADPRRDGSVRVMTTAAALWSIPQLAALPIMSRDMYAYVAQGRMMLAGKDPYKDTISDVPNWLQLGADSMWAYDGTPYGPVFLWIEKSVVSATASLDVEVALLLFRLVAVLGVVLTAVFVPLICRYTAVPPAYAQWLTVANPLFLVHFVASGHNDALMVGLAVAGTWCAMRAGYDPAPRSTLARIAWGLAGVLLVTLSLGVKPITAVLLPFIGLLWAGPRAGWVRRFVFWAVTAAAAAVVMAVIGWLNGVGFGWLAVLAATGTGFSPWAPIGLTYWLVTQGLDLAGATADPAAVLENLKTFGRITSMLIVLVLMFWGRQDRALHRMAWAFAALVILSPVVQPWYLLWLLPFFAVAGIRDDWRLTWVVFTVVFFLTYGAQDQLFVWPFLDVEGRAKLASVGVSVLGILWCLGLDPRTRHVLRGRLPARRRRSSAEGGEAADPT